MWNSAARNIAFAAVAAALLLAGGFAWWWHDRRAPVDAEALDDLSRSLAATNLDITEQLTSDIDARQLAEEKERAESETGVGLYNLCTTWAEFHSNHPSDDTLENRDRACGDYRRYVSTGELPPDLLAPLQKKARLSRMKWW